MLRCCRRNPCGSLLIFLLFAALGAQIRLVTLGEDLGGEWGTTAAQAAHAGLLALALLASCCPGKRDKRGKSGLPLCYRKEDDHLA